MDGENIVIRRNETEVLRLPMHNLESVVTFGYTGASPALMGALAERHIALNFLSRSGRFLARVTGKEYGNVLLRRQQYRIADDEARSAAVARHMIAGKLYNARWVLERATRDHALRVDTGTLKRASAAIHAGMADVMVCESLERLRGLEGEASARYFSVFDQLILRQRDVFFFDGRNRRPPMDNLNALLSFTYTLLAGDVAAALESVGLDPYVGFLHRDRPGRVSLALDLMEELRPVMADRFVLSLINKQEVSGDGFSRRENDAVVMDDATRKALLTAWQTRKQEIITHPFLGEKLEWGLLPYVQSVLLARLLRGDLDAYPAFLWK